jgi:hypothetical protein
VVVLGVAFTQKLPMFHGIIAVMDFYKSAKAMDKQMTKNCPYLGQNLPKKKAGIQGLNIFSVIINDLFGFATFNAYFRRKICVVFCQITTQNTQMS